MADKIIIDTCVFLEGIFHEDETSSSELLSKLDTLDGRLIFSQDTIGELFYIIKRKCNELKLTEQETSDVLTNIAVLFQYGKSTNTRRFKSKKNKILVKDKDDQMFVDLAFASDATHLITLDRKSGMLKLKGVPFICCTPKVYLDSLNKLEATS
jgi:putative PIN family toxin of toxin-antitoxin system